MSVRARYADYRSHGHTRFTAAVLALPPEGCLLFALVAGSLLGYLLMWFLPPRGGC